MCGNPDGDSCSSSNIGLASLTTETSVRPTQSLSLIEPSGQPPSNQNVIVSSRLDRLGPASLLSLLAGGIILTFASLNALTAPTSLREGKSLGGPNAGIRFRLGCQLGIQAWTAIIGIGFALLSYGFSDARIHLFDWWCSHQAHLDTGLDYGRYLNSQPRAPVAYGVRGFASFGTLRYLFLLLSIGASVGYKFGILQVNIQSYRDLNPDDFKLETPSFYDLLESSWLLDSPAKGTNGGFLHDYKTKTIKILF